MSTLHNLLNIAGRLAGIVLLAVLFTASPAVGLVDHSPDCDTNEATGNTVCESCDSTHALCCTDTYDSNNRWLGGFCYDGPQNPV